VKVCLLLKNVTVNGVIENKVKPILTITFTLSPYSFASLAILA
jgi:hypothetical protein